MKNRGIKLAKKALQTRPRRFSVIWMLPNFLTICALIFGLQAMYQAIFNNWDNVIIMIIIASVFDMLDGRVARLLKSTSEFGMHLDSLSDFVVFGAVPAFSIYLWMDKPQGNFFWIVIVLYVICSALRLARFNSELSERPNYAKNYFTGVPTPAAAFLMLFPIAIDEFLMSYNLKSFDVIHPCIGENYSYLNSMRKKQNLNFLIEVDGGVGPDHVKPCLDSGVDVLVAGTAYYKLDGFERKQFAKVVENS